MSETRPAPESRCICGKVSLQFLQPGPVLHVHCCCADCRQAHEWVASNGGPPMKSAVTQAYYIENDIAELAPDAF